MSTTSQRKAVVICTLIAMLVGALVVGAIMVNRASAAARRIKAYGRLAQMRVALQSFEEEHGALPPLCLRDNLGKPIQSWRALILPYLGGELPRLSKQMNLSQRWNSDSNDSLVASVPPGDWVYFAWDRPRTKLAVSTHIVAYLGRASIWDARTGLPRGRTTEHPDAVLLLWLATGNIHPLQPGDITEDEVRERIEKGEQVLFIAADSSSSTGIVTVERGEVVFHTDQQVLDEKKAGHL
jgi:hypothetical protein